MIFNNWSINLNFVDLLRVCKHKAFALSFPKINNVYAKIFSRELGRLSESGGPFEKILARNPAICSLDNQKNYFLFKASYGDKWCILSFLPEHLNLYPNSYVIASHSDRTLIEIFIGQAVMHARFIFIDQEALNNFSDFFYPSSMLSMPIPPSAYTKGCLATVTSFFIGNGLPPGTIRHLHLVNYPYFNELFYLHGISYGTLLKVLLYLPAGAKSVRPSFYTEFDYKEAKDLIKSTSPGSSSPPLPAVLFNVVNFSHMPLKIDQVSMMIATLENHGYRVLLNITGSPDYEKLASVVSCHHKQVVLLTIPPRLLALICDNVQAVIGVLGGAMNVAVQFSRCHVLSIQTPNLGAGCSEDELNGEWGKDKIWEWYDKDWPCLLPNRVVINTFLGDPSTIANESLRVAIQSFLRTLPPSA